MMAITNKFLILQPSARRLSFFPFLAKSPFEAANWSHGV
jgi:hypothetical protein